ncbi:MAG: hypothetical protein WA118_04205 [Carboxydocellales bacterium]
MLIWLLVGLILTLALGLSIGELVISYHKGFWQNIVRYFLVGVVGFVTSAVSMVLIIIAVWPPYSSLSVLLPFGFIVLVLGVLHFVKSTNAVIFNDEAKYNFAENFRNIDKIT